MADPETDYRRYAIRQLEIACEQGPASRSLNAEYLASLALQLGRVPTVQDVRDDQERLLRRVEGRE
jgi:hypothetical protein